MGDAKTQSEKLWTPANVVTLVRICLVPVFVVVLISPWPQYFGIAWVSDETKSLIAAGVFILISATDWLDGYLARSRNEITSFGKFMDPLADKILVAAALLALIELSVLPSWPVLIILAREFIVSGIRMVAATQGTVIAASWYGKAKTVTQIIAIVLFIVKDSIFPVDPENALENPLYVLSWLVMIVALVLTIISMLDYFVKARHLLGFVRDGDAEAADEAKESQCNNVLGESLDSSIEQLARCVVETALSQGKTIATAESLTGGLIASALTSIPGSSGCIRGGVVSYVNDVKRDVLGVSNACLLEKGAVCSEVACSMASGVQKRLGCDIAIAVTGIAGPGGAEAGKPVGTVWAGLSTAKGVRAAELHFTGSRAQIRAYTVEHALRMLKEELEA